MKENKLRWTWSALAAAEKGDLENAIIAMTPGGIEAQEAAGQRDFVANETLPINTGYGTTKEQIEALGIEYIEPADDLFWHVRLPAGWKKVATDHSMHSDLIDDKGRKRASIFYKAVFYDRRADIDLAKRYGVQVQPVGGWTNDREGVEWHGSVTDCGEAIWSTEHLDPEPPYNSVTDGQDKRQAWLDWQERKDGLGKQCREWLDEHYPDWKSPLAYWD